MSSAVVRWTGKVPVRTRSSWQSFVIEFSRFQHALLSTCLACRAYLSGV